MQQEARRKGRGRIFSLESPLPIRSMMPRAKHARDECAVKQAGR